MLITTMEQDRLAQLRAAQERQKRGMVLAGQGQPLESFGANASLLASLLMQVQGDVLRKKRRNRLAEALAASQFEVGLTGLARKGG